ncbi:malonate decarboxylase subunit epsilon [Halalkalibacter krulwichiae]|uniref:Malonyl CoA-acyl carrier protein transacylase n=1 Tax=Halalkalibacter krulwichiae TaxID=199441 RepID=A0A1X9M8M1_9BACI|nr:malonate decarboxylase subunit epsilon [Halalkalibacter krulwichiae]ARK29799.1 Malonyl CoA-acyl carrier protein transacylase [Halalkalibacter krulwichiae]
MKVAFLFPGQGSQQANMLHDLPRSSIVDEALREASEALEEDVLHLDTKESLRSTVAVQISLLVASVASARLLEEQGVKPDAVAGHSVGAYGAAVVANVLSFQDAVKIVKLRGELMERAYPSGYGMGVVSGIMSNQLERIIGQLSINNEPIYLTNINSPNQVTISGSVKGINKLLLAVKKEGARKAELLQVNVPSHCELMKPIANELACALEQITFRNPRIPFASNRTARLLRNAQLIKEELAFNVSKPVRWHEITQILYERGTRLFVELPPNHVLTDLASAAFPDARAISVMKMGIRSTSLLINREQSVEN